MLTYLPLSMRPGHTATAKAISATRRARRTDRIENAIIDRVDLDRKRAADKKLAAMKPMGKVC